MLTALQHDQAVTDPVVRECRLELVGALSAVGPALEVERDRHASPEYPCDIGRAVGRKRQVSAVELRELDGACVQDRDWDLAVFSTIVRTTSRETLSPEK